MKIGEESICYQHHMAQDILEKELRDITLNIRQRDKLKEAIE